MNNIKIKSIENYECIGPCYPANTPYYNPSNLALITNFFPSCPIKEQLITNSDGLTYKKFYGKCNIDDINEEYLNFDIFSDTIQIATSHNNFITEIYNLNNITDIVRFLSNEFDIIPIYSQRRLLGAIYLTYYKFVEFPKLLFAKKLLFILKNLYEISNLNENKILYKLDNLEYPNTKDLYSLFY